MSWSVAGGEVFIDAISAGWGMVVECKVSHLGSRLAAVASRADDLFPLTFHPVCAVSHRLLPD